MLQKHYHLHNAIFELQQDDDGKGLTSREIRDHVDSFLFGGHDTTASGKLHYQFVKIRYETMLPKVVNDYEQNVLTKPAISWTLYNFAKYPEYQERCREEVNDVLKEEKDVKW